MLKLGLNAIGMSLPLWALAVVWFSLGLAVGLGIIAALAFIVGGLIDDDPTPDERAADALDNHRARELR